MWDSFIYIRHVIIFCNKPIPLHLLQKLKANYNNILFKMQVLSWKKHERVALNHNNNDWTSYWTAEDITAIKSIALCNFIEKQIYSYFRDNGCWIALSFAR